MAVNLKKVTNTNELKLIQEDFNKQIKTILENMANGNDVDKIYKDLKEQYKKYVNGSANTTMIQKIIDKIKEIYLEASKKISSLAPKDLEPYLANVDSEEYLVIPSSIFPGLNNSNAILPDQVAKLLGSYKNGNFIPLEVRVENKIYNVILFNKSKFEEFSKSNKALLNEYIQHAVWHSKKPLTIKINDLNSIDNIINKYIQLEMQGLNKTPKLKKIFNDKIKNINTDIGVKASLLMTFVKPIIINNFNLYKKFITAVGREKNKELQIKLISGLMS